MDKKPDMLRSYIHRIAEGENLESIGEDIAKESINTAQRAIHDVHQVVNGAQQFVNSAQQVVNDAQKEVTAQMVQEAIAKRDSFPQKDYSDKKEKAARLEAVKGHPLSTFTLENDAFSKRVREFRESRDAQLLSGLCELSVHYAKKGDLIYPLLKEKYGVVGPSDLMWTEDDEIRDELRALSKDEVRGMVWDKRVDTVLKRAEDMAFKEQNILFPICAVNFTEDEWIGIYQDSRDYDPCFSLPRTTWEEAEAKASELEKAEEEKRAKMIAEGEVAMPGGHMTVEQMTALLNTLPVEITFIDDKNINRFFNEGPKVFKRPHMAIDREVFSCHPPKVEIMVRGIVQSFKEGTKDVVPVWMEKGGRTLFVRYMAVRDKNGTYLGTVEVVQDMEFAKEHFLEKK